MATNQSIIEKAAMTLSDLSSGGLMNTKQFNTFYRKMIDEPTILRDARNIPMTPDSMKIEKIGFGQRILRGATEGLALTDAQRSKPQTSTITLNAKEVIAEVNITYDTLENNIEQGGLQNTIMDMLSARVALDLEELIINGDTASADAYLAVLNGMRKKATSHIVDVNGTEELAQKHFARAINALPNKYFRNPNDYRFYTSFSNELKWKDAVTARQTALGDAAHQGQLPTAYGVGVKGIAMLQDYDLDGVGAGTVMGSDGFLVNPKNIIVGFSRNIRVEVDKDIRERKFIIVLTAKLDVQYEEEDAVVKIQKIKAPTF